MENILSCFKVPEKDEKVDLKQYLYGNPDTDKLSGLFTKISTKSNSEGK